MNLFLKKTFKLEVWLRDNALVVLRQNLKKAEQERDDLKLKLEKLQTSYKNLIELLASQTNDKTGFGYNSQVFTRAMFDCDDYLSSGSDESLPSGPIYDRYKSGNGYHVVPPPNTRTFMPPKPDLVFNNALNDVETDHFAFTVKLSPTKHDQDFVQPNEQVKPPRPSVKPVETSILAANPKTTISKPSSKGNSMNKKACFVCKSLTYLIKDCDFYEKKMAQTTARNHAQRGNHKPITTVVLKPTVTRPRQAKTVVTKPTLPPRRHINHSPSTKASNFPPQVNAVKASMVNAAKGVQGKWEWKLKSLTMEALTALTCGGKLLAFGDRLWLMCLLGGKVGLVTTVLAYLGLVTVGLRTAVVIGLTPVMGTSLD
uniref:Uncharacterized protein n=1 Tax=Tanacetum cinerariifolium TaxID=118510 RepID=A0A699JYE9_TANCI|nr:hypothetical protein [Tanacetum cinerariifolium]